MIGTLHSIVIDCPDPPALAEFYRGILGGEILSDDHTDADDRWVDLAPASGPRLSFQRSPGYVPPRWPGDDGDQQSHLDVLVEDLDAAHEHLLALGARHLESHATFRVYLDPVGHPFCTIV
ncbi:VOC family protein [Leucobacter weissii]|uniref:VOC family protein n=1 Tax=Leucobacter weissii TaxID=1983706 RepID=A0A939SBZ4_9MICO|nr:VOC family protein [Leucobacter weissii]MBO1901858.1 VOC family protein [Leucobacter weissii]